MALWRARDKPPVELVVANLDLALTHIYEKKEGTVKSSNMMILQYL